MFDAKQLLDALTRSTAQPAAQTPGQGGLGDLLGQILGGGQKQNPQVSNMAPEQQQRAPGGLGDLLGQILGGGQKQNPQVSNMAPEPQQRTPGGLGDLLGGVLGKMQPGGQQPTDASRPVAPGGLGNLGGLGGLGEILGNVFGQATQGVKEGAGRINDATGAGNKLDDLLRQVTGGQASGDMLGKVKDMIGNNPMTAGAVLGGLGALVGGTKTGRTLAVDAAKIGGLVLIGGLAYKAWQNYQGGKPLISGREATPQHLAIAAPDGSGFEESVQTNESAILYLKAMIAAAAADGEIDQDELTRITGNLKQIGFNEGAREFLEQEFSNPASIEDLVQAAGSGEVAAQVYTAARITIDPDTREEKQWLATLGKALGLEPGLIAHIDAAAHGVKA